ncbi:hypothetical protein HCN44_004634 [Aphidius gifuensis]|uniref:Uncharacterized protein n=2 Tax=Aphidius gifuensis TaxID=684658 RepID=A0A835CT96_APHGI|nr:hypothetical protein HCN44_004634 [Aphidius gifuensis]
MPGYRHDYDSDSDFDEEESGIEAKLQNELPELTNRQIIVLERLSIYMEQHISSKSTTRRQLKNALPELTNRQIFKISRIFTSQIRSSFETTTKPPSRHTRKPTESSEEYSDED